MRRGLIIDRRQAAAIRRHCDFEISSIFSSVKDLLKSAILWIKRKLGIVPPEERNVFQKIGDGLKYAWKKIGIVDKIKGTKDRISVIWDILGIIAKVKAFFGKVTSIPSQLVDAVKAIFSKIVLAMSIAKASAKPLDSARLLLAYRRRHGDLDIKGKFAKLKEKFTSLKGKVASISDSVINKIKSAIEKIKEKIQQAKEMKDKAKRKIYEAELKLLAKAIEAIAFVVRNARQGKLKEASLEKLRTIAASIKEKAGASKTKFVAVIAAALEKFASKVKAMLEKIKSLPSGAKAK